MLAQIMPVCACLCVTIFALGEFFRSTLATYLENKEHLSKNENKTYL